MSNSQIIMVCLSIYGNILVSTVFLHFPRCHLMLILIQDLKRRISTIQVTFTTLHAMRREERKYRQYCEMILLRLNVVFPVIECLHFIFFSTYFSGFSPYLFMCAFFYLNMIKYLHVMKKSL